MIEIFEGVPLNPVIRKAVATTVDVDAQWLTHVFYTDYVALFFNNDNNESRMFYTKNEYIDYLMGMYEEGAIFGDKPLEYREKCKALLKTCKDANYHRGRLEFSFDEIIAITEHYHTGWFSDANMNRWGTLLIRTLPYRMFVTSDKGYGDNRYYNLRIITDDGYIVNLMSLQSEYTETIAFANGLKSALDFSSIRDRAIVANLHMVWDTSNERGFKTALTFCDFNENSFTVATDDYRDFIILNS